jgi:hypothetical protein
MSVSTNTRAAAGSSVAVNSGVEVIDASPAEVAQGSPKLRGRDSFDRRPFLLRECGGE